MPLVPLFSSDRTYSQGDINYFVQLNTVILKPVYTAISYRGVNDQQKVVMGLVCR